jgi:hypothetical protein
MRSLRTRCGQRAEYRPVRFQESSSRTRVATNGRTICVVDVSSLLGTADKRDHVNRMAAREGQRGQVAPVPGMPCRHAVGSPGSGAAPALRPLPTSRTAPNVRGSAMDGLLAPALPNDRYAALARPLPLRPRWRSLAMAASPITPVPSSTQNGDSPRSNRGLRYDRTPPSTGGLRPGTTPAAGHILPRCQQSRIGWVSSRSFWISSARTSRRSAATARRPPMYCCAPGTPWLRGAAADSS